METKQEGNAFILLDNQQKIGEITFVPVNDSVIEANHTFIDPSHRGQDLGYVLIDALVDYARLHQLTILPACPYVNKIFNKEAKYHDVWQTSIA